MSGVASCESPTRSSGLRSEPQAWTPRRKSVNPHGPAARGPEPTRVRVPQGGRTYQQVLSASAGSEPSTGQSRPPASSVQSPVPRPSPLPRLRDVGAGASRGPHRDHARGPQRGYVRGHARGLHRDRAPRRRRGGNRVGALVGDLGRSPCVRHLRLLGYRHVTWVSPPQSKMLRSARRPDLRKPCSSPGAVLPR